MRHHTIQMLAIAAMASAAVLALAQSARAVVFPDKNLEAALRALVFEKKNNAEELTDDDLRKISTLEAKGRKIQNLSGLGKMHQFAAAGCFEQRDFRPESDPHVGPATVAERWRKTKLSI